MVGVTVNVRLIIGVGEGVFVGDGVGEWVTITSKAAAGVIVGIGVETVEITDPIKFVDGV